MIYRVKQPFAYTTDRGIPRVLRAGDLISGDHEGFRENRLKYLELVDEYVARGTVESATAAPGEKRSLTAPASVDIDALRAAAEEAGVKVDKRWGVDKLRSEIAAADPGKSEE